jgi:hypothetical protein
LFEESLTCYLKNIYGMRLKFRMISTMRATVFALTWTLPSVSYTESYYLSQMKQAQWDTKALDKTVEKLEEHRPIEFAGPLKLSPFHAQSAIEEAPQRDFCVTCHTVLPHTKNERTRSYLNMHVNYIACSSCHFQPDDMVLDYRWHQWNPSRDQRGTSAISLITPFSSQGMESFNAKHSDIAERLALWEASKIRQKAQLHLQFHTPLQSEGMNCPACHTKEQPVLDYIQLGYDRDEITLMTDNRIARYLGDQAFEDKPIKLMDLLQ